MLVSPVVDCVSCHAWRVTRLAITHVVVGTTQNRFEGYARTSRRRVVRRGLRRRSGSTTSAHLIFAQRIMHLLQLSA